MSDKFAARTKNLQVGTRLKHAIHDANDVLLLAAGSTIIEGTKKQLLRLGVDHILIHHADRDAAQEPTARDTEAPRIEPAPTEWRPAELDQRINRLLKTVSIVVANKGAAVRDRITYQGCRPYGADAEQRLARKLDEAANLIEGVARDLLSGIQHHAESLASIANGYLMELENDSDVVVSSIINRPTLPKINVRSVRICLLGMAMAAEMSFDEHHACNVGMCGLVHDWGIYTLPDRLQDFHQPFQREDWSSYFQHSSATIKVLERMDGLDDEIRLAACQTHELPDGTGYPRGLTKERIHPYAKILAVADAYISLTSQIRGRPAIVPHDVMALLLHLVQRGKCDGDVVRSLLQVLSLFPLGSHVELSDGGVAVVLRRNGSNYSQPIVRRIETPYDDTVFDLASNGLQIRRPIPRLKFREMRLHRGAMPKINWEDRPECVVDPQ